MAFARNSLRAFLQYAKRNLAEATKGRQKVNIVVGNESADLDSLTSSLLYAYIRSTAPPQNAFSPIYIPLLNIPSSGLRLRPEFAAVCKHANISPSSLITLDDFPLHQQRLEHVHWTLVDHNKLQGALGEQYAFQVYGVVDHHDEEGAVPQDTGPEPRIIGKCGSCTSLVTRYCMSSWNSISSASLFSGAAHGQGDLAVDDGIVTQNWDAQIAKLALASILIDTANLKAPGKVQDVDVMAVNYLEAKIQLSSKDAKSWDRDKFFEEIDEAKSDIDHLTLSELLTKDYKQWSENGNHLGISSTVKPLDILVKKGEKSQADNFEKELSRFMHERDLSVFAIMTTSTSPEGEFMRELLIQATEPAHTLMRNFVERAMPPLQLEDIHICEIPTQDKPPPGKIWRKVWMQRDVSKSRKQVAPLLREAIRG